MTGLDTRDSEHWSKLDDEILVKAHLGGDQNAFQVLFKKYREMVSRLVGSIVKQDSLVEDVVQDVFVLVFKNLPKFRGDSALKTWVYRIAVNEAVRRKNREKRWVLLDDPEKELQGSSSTIVILNKGSESPERFVIEGEKREMIDKALANLKPTHRMALTLYYLEDLDIKEISEILEIPEGSVKSRLYYARDALKKALEPVLLKASNEGIENHGL